ncbi:GGDEF domain-containing protein [Actinotalea sp.]|uniref:GGDEF domain-containing protein n=1 Tax=Actinotalea sp. TaxID=1872145 RepID=UPI003564B720
MARESADRRPSEFWRHHLRSGQVISAVVPVAVAVRTAVRPDAPHPTAIYVICATVLLLTPLTRLTPIDRLVSRNRVQRVFYSWEVLGIALLTAVVVLDGGASSPFRAFLFVLVAHAALAFPPSGTLAMGALGVLAYALVGALGPAHEADSTTIVAGALALTTVVCATASHNYLALHEQVRAVAARATALADEDGLTGCLNHRAFHEKVSAATTAGPPDLPISVLVLDVDHFKSINDEHGHPVGDEVLARLGQAVRAACRAEDTPGRIGGDEFALLLVGADESGAAAARERLQRLVGDGRLPHGATVTIGTASGPAGTPARTLMARADAELYAARRRARI